MSAQDEFKGLTEPFLVANEFTRVQVRKVATVQGERLELVLPKTGATVRLDAMQLEAVIGLTARNYSAIFDLMMDGPGK